ncbi:MAG: hypothetical protein LOD87_12060, partial [Planifilum fulgidum]
YWENGDSSLTPRGTKRYHWFNNKTNMGIRDCPPKTGGPSKVSLRFRGCGAGGGSENDPVPK